MVSGKKILLFILPLCCLLLFNPLSGPAEENIAETHRQILNLAQTCRGEVIDTLDLLLSKGSLTTGKLFDTFYIPIPDTDPQKYHTQYDKIFDAHMRSVIDDCLAKDNRLIFVVLVDRNGYLPTHNSKYSIPHPNDRELDLKWNRTKRIFNDRTGLAAARNKNKSLLQQYERDTGETIYDLSIPIMIQGRHWGGLRLGYRK